MRWKRHSYLKFLAASRIFATKPILQIFSDTGTWNFTREGELMRVVGLQSIITTNRRRKAKTRPSDLAAQATTRGRILGGRTLKVAAQTTYLTVSKVAQMIKRANRLMEKPRHFLICLLGT
jgi:hypothetical protein